MRTAIIAGGGIAGVCAARVLRQTGVAVTLIDTPRPGAATPAAAGILMRVGAAKSATWEALALAGAAAYPQLCAALDDTGFEQRGLLAHGAVTDELEVWAQTHALESEWLSAAQVAERFPELRPARMLFLPTIAQVDPPRLLAALRRALIADGVTWEIAHVDAVCSADDRVTGVRAGTRTWAADQVVVACGAWSNALFGDTACPQIVPRRGELLVWREVATAHLPIVLEDTHYLVFRDTGEVLCGAPDVAVGFDTDPDAAVHAELAAFARHWCPDLLAGPPAETRLGFRPQADTGLPVTAAHPSISGLYCHSGHYRHGIVCAPAAAAELAQIMVADGESHPRL